MFLQQYLYLLLIIGLGVQSAESGTENITPFAVGTRYEYSYSAEISLKEVDKFHFTASALVSAYELGPCGANEGVSMVEIVGVLNCTAVQIVLTDTILVSVQAREHGQQILEHRLNFSNWFSFYQRQDGVISKVRYPANESVEVLQLKKAVSSSFSLKLHSYVRNKGTSKLYGGWTYRVPDVDHTGTHSARYEVKDSDKVTQYKKIRKDLKNDYVHNKEIHILKETGHIKLIRVEDIAEVSQSTPEPNSMEEPPPIKANGLSHIILLKKYTFDPSSIVEPSALILDSIIAQRAVRDPIKYRTGLSQVQSNLSLTENCYPTTNIECVKIIRKIVNIIELMREQDIVQLSSEYLSCPLIHRYSNVLTMIDALGMCSRASCQFMLVSFINASCIEREMAFSILPHFSSLKRPSLLAVNTMYQLAFNPERLPKQLRNHTLSDMAVLAVGSMSASLREYDPLLSGRIVSKLHRMTLSHDHDRYRRDDSPKHAPESVAMMRQSSLIHSLGNARHESSFNLLKSFIESQHAPTLLRRSAVHSLRGYNTDEAAEIILSAALIDSAEVVRYEATVQYQLHPKADEMSQVLYEFYNYTNSEQSPAGTSKRRIRRFNIFAALSFHLQTPSFNWKKDIGTNSFGASMGLIVENIIDLKIKPLSGTFMIDVHDEAYFVANLGFVGVHFDVFRARVCFQGHISYNLNILQELGINSFSDLAHIYDNTIGAVINAIKEAIKSFRAVLGEHIDIRYIFHTLVEAVSELPFIIENLVVSPTLRRILEQLKELPFIQKGIMLLDEVKSLYSDVRSDVLMFYQEISDCVTVTLPWVGETIKTAVITIVKSIEHFFRNPLISIRDVIVSIFQLRSAFDAVIDCKDVLLNATKFQGAHIRGWMDLVNRLKEIYNTTIETKDLIIKEAKEFSEIRNVSSFEHATGLNLTILRLKAYGDLKKALEKFIEPLAPLLKIVEPFIKAYTSAVNVIKTAIRAYEILKETYEKVKDLIERLFGPKYNRKFPRVIRGEDSCKETKCECGFYPTTSGDSKIYRKGLQLEIEEGDALVAPTSGLYLRIPDNQVLIYPSGSFSKYVIMIHNVKLLDNITSSGINVQGGDKIGTVTENGFGCQPNFIHFTMMTKSSGHTMNPFPFLQPRFLEIPKWVQECNDFSLIVLGQVVKMGPIIGKNRTTKGQNRTCGDEDYCKNPELPDNNEPPPNKSAYKPKYTNAISGDPSAKNALLPNASSNGPRGPLDRPIGTNIGRYFTKEQVEKYSKEPVEKGGFHIVVTGGGNEFNFSVNTIKIRLILDILKKLSSDEIKEIIDTVENTIEFLRKALDCSNEKIIDPSLLDLESIQNALKIRGLPYQGEKEQLIADLIALPKDLCPNLQHAIPKHRWCVLSEDCLSLRCAAALKLDFFKYSVTFSITLDPCTPSITLRFQDLEKVIKLPNIYGGHVMNIAHEAVELLGIATINLDVKLTRKDLNIYLDFTAYLCPPGEPSDDYSKCFFSLELLAGAGFQIPSPYNCTTKKSRREVTAPTDVTPCGIKIPDFLNMTLSEFVTYIKDFGDAGSANYSTNKLNQLMQDLRNVFLNELLQAIISGKSPISGDDTDFPTKFEICIAGSFGRQFYKNFYSLSEYIIIGWVPLHFTLSLDGLYGFSLGAKVCFISMVASTEATPNVGLVLSGSAAISIFIAEVGIRLTGIIMNTHLPIQPSVGFKKFPLALRLRIDVNIIPLGISVHIYLKITINLWFVHFSITIFSIEIFHWNSPAIILNLLDITNEDKDNSPPLFSPITGQSRSRRSLSSLEDHRVFRRDVATPCTVTQVAGRDYTNPAFILQINVADDKSQVELTYSVGTYKGGNDIVNNERMNGNTVLIARKLTSNIPLYWTATGSNSQGVSSSTQCSLNTYDMTPPDGRVDFDTFIYSSHPTKLIGEAVIIDDTNLKMQFRAIGYGPGPFGDQTVPFTAFDFDQLNLQSAATNTLQNFIIISNKRLGVTPFKVFVVTNLQACASDCLAFPTKCFSFNYADVHRVCELLNDIGADASIEFADNLQYSYYEKRGVGNRASFKYKDLPLVHDRLYFLNLYIVNQLLYESYINSPGMLMDFTPPEPGVVRNVSLNETRHDGCSAAFNQRCGPPEYVTPLEYHRIIQDGPGSECVYNGPSIEEDIKYSRLNSFVSVTFQGIHDYQSGMYAYAWYMGYEPCKEGALSPRDPRADSTTQLSDRIQGRAFQHFDDGIYYNTVQGLNRVIFGSSGVLTLCHSTPYIIDTTPPIIYNVTLIAYNEYTNISTFFYEAWDNLSGLKIVELGVGLTISDISILQWTKIFTNRTATLTHQINVPDGTRAFIRIKATNHVDLTSTSYAPRPIIVDRSPPSPGVVLDGDGPGNSNWKYQASGSVLCAKWRDFYDPQSGISAYRWGAGTAPGLSNTVPFTDNLLPDIHSICREGLQLKHDTIYYSTVIAFNSDTDHPRNISVSSNGVLVDLTNPIGGFVNDGASIHQNQNYTSNPKSVQAVWGGFSDPQSGIAQYNATIYSAQISKYLPTSRVPELDQKCPVPSDSSAIPIKPPFIPPDSVKFEISQGSVSVGLKTRVEWEHFEFSHGDYVRTTITGQDGATRTTDVTSQGILVDLTPPRIFQLYDGPSPQIDESFQTSISTLSASWIMVDPESGISEYRLTVFARIGGSTSQFYPETTPYETIQPQEVGESGVLTCWSASTQLSIGTLYTISIAPINRANLSTVFTSSGIIPDNTPPVIVKLQIDTYGDESEEITPEDAVEIGNTGGIPVHWLATDPESGIAGFEAAVGTFPGGTDVADFKEYSADSNVIIPVELQLYEKTNEFYYVTVKAKNGAGLLSAANVSTKIKVLRANVAGVVTVGHSGVRSNGQFQPERDTVTLAFQGFSSELCGIQYYEWSMGTSFAEDQIQEFTTAGVVVGGEGSGVAQALIPLELGEKVYTEVRAVTACSNEGQQATINSFGKDITVDWTAPYIQLTDLGQRKNGSAFKNTQPDSKIYQYNPSTLLASWNATDPQSGIENYKFEVGTHPYSDRVTPPKTTRKSSLLSTNVDPAQNGNPNILQITAFNRAGLPTFLIAPGITIDTNIPSIHQVQFNCTKYATTKANSLTCHWHGAFDQYSEIIGYEIMLGEAEVDSTYYYKYLNSDALMVTMTNFSTNLQPGEQVYTLNIINSVGLINHKFASLIIDDTDPLPRAVNVLLDQTRIGFFPTGKANSSFSYRNISSYTQCITIVTNIRVKWEAFVDDETPMDYYEIGLGEKIGQINIMNFYDIGLVNEYFLEGIDLTLHPVIFVIIRGFNRVGLYQVANSHPIYISLHNPQNAYVFDGSKSHDLQAQTGTSYLEAFWNFYDPCLDVSYDWGIFYANQTIVQNLTSVQTTDSSNNNLAIDKDTQVYVLVNLRSSLGYVRSARSDGITVQVAPLIPGVVYDGPFPGVDFNHQASLTTLMANWNSFGGTNPMRLSEYVIKYELGIGTQPRGDNRFNVVTFRNVYLNTSITLFNLKLQTNNTYYVTIRATSGTFQRAEVTSNGIQPIRFDNIVQPGIVSIPRFQSATGLLDISWKGFTSLLPIVSFEYAISTDAGLANFSCKSFENAASPLAGYFSITPYTKSQFVSTAVVSGLQLRGATQYYAYVRAIDDSFQCVAAVSNPIEIDTTPPILGNFNIGFNVSSLRPDVTVPQISYVTTSNTLTVSWVGFYDPESSIENYQIQLVTEKECDTLMSCNGLTAFTTINNVTKHTFYVLNILAEKFYFVALRAINRAGLASCKVSQPIKLDKIIPNPAVVKQGSDWKYSPPFQGSTTTLRGILALVTDQHEAICMDRMYNESSSREGWHTVNQSVTPTIPVGPDNPTGRTLAYSPKQALFNTEHAFLEISMTRDIQHNRMLSAAAGTKFSVVSFNEISIRIKAAPNFTAVTSVLIWDGPDSMIQDYEILYTTNDSNITQTKLDPSTTIHSSCVYIPPPNPSPKSYRAFGLQLHPPSNSTPARALLWYRGEEMADMAHEWIALDFNPTTDYHTYHFTLEKKSTITPSTVVEYIWSVLLKVDDQFLGSLVGLPQFGSSLYFVLHVRNYNGRVEPFSDPFFPPTTSAFYTDVILPVNSSRVCKYGNPFYSEIAPYIKFDVAAGKRFNSTDVSLAAGREYQPIALPCIPCKEYCRSEPNTCNSYCNSSVYYINFEATGLELVSGCTHPFNKTNTTCTPYNYNTSGIPEDQLYLYNLTFVPYAYYMTVRGYTASGHIAYGYSQGIQLDPTPPNCTLIEHIQRDLRNNQLVNTTVQYSTDSLAVRYLCVDTRSDVSGYEIAYSDNIDDTSSLQFNSVGTNTTVNITNLSLNPLLKYYVVVRATNGAGLTTILKSDGIRILNREPDVSRAVLLPLFSTTVSTNLPNTSISSQLTSLGLTWTGFYQTHYEDDYSVKNQTFFWTVGTEPNKQDIIPLFEINFNSSFAIRINETDMIGNTSFFVSNITELAKLANKTNFKYVKGDKILQIEPGKVLFHTLILCAIQPKCRSAGTHSVTFYRQTDRYSVASSNQEFSLSIEKGNQEYPSQSTDAFIPQQLYPTNCRVYFPGNIKSGSGFVIGNLTLDDMRIKYDVLTAPSSSPYTPFIVDPSSTLQRVDRFLFSRVQHFLGPAFFISPIGGQQFPSWLEFEINFNATRVEGGMQPILTAWDPDQQRWIATRSSCNFTKDDTINDNTLTTYFCPCAQTNKRCDKPWQFILVLATSEFIDTPPVPEAVPCVSITEGSSTIKHPLSYTDAQGDSVEYNLTSVVSTHSLVASINDSMFYFTPCKRCFGNVTVKYRITETGTPALLDRPLDATNAFRIEILAVNDNPVLVLLVKGNKTSFTLYRDYNTSVASVEFGFYSYDEDSGDQVHFRYLNCSHCSLVLGNSTSSERLLIPAKYRASSLGESLQYTAYAGYYGGDQFGVVAQDRSGAYSLAHVFTISIKYRPCLHNSTCKGPANDPECDDILTESDFTYNYTCECTDEWALRRCSVPNTCISQPCRYNASCQVKEDGTFECICGPNWPCSLTSSQSLTAAELSAVVIAVFIAILIVAGIVLGICVYTLKHKKSNIYTIIDGNARKRLALEGEEFAVQEVEIAPLGSDYAIPLLTDSVL